MNRRHPREALTEDILAAAGIERKLDPRDILWALTKGRRLHGGIRNALELGAGLGGVRAAAKEQRNADPAYIEHRKHTRIKKVAIALGVATAAATATGITTSTQAHERSAHITQEHRLEAVQPELTAAATVILDQYKKDPNAFEPIVHEGPDEVIMTPNRLNAVVLQSSGGSQPDAGDAVFTTWIGNFSPDLDTTTSVTLTTGGQATAAAANAGVTNIPVDFEGTSGAQAEISDLVGASTASPDPGLTWSNEWGIISTHAQVMPPFGPGAGPQS